MKNIDKVQNLLPLGYLFLIILGITKESIFYYQIGINIIKYSSIMDILISPIAAMMSHPIFLATIALTFIFFYNLPQILLKNEKKKWLYKMFGVKNDNNELDKLSEDEKQNHFITISIKFLSVFLISFFLGYGFADGKVLSERIKKNKLEYKYKLNYGDESENVYMIGSNTAYYFYLTEGNPNIKIAPIGSVKNLELTKNRMLDK